MNLIYYRSYLLLLFLLITGSLQAQQKLNLESWIPPAPNAAELGKYGTMPVGTLTGIPEIGFPLYEITSGSLKLPISLSYHASGNQVNQRSTDVGLSWSVNAGGQISRTVYGAKDDSQYGYFNYTPPSYATLMGLTNYYTMQFYSNPGYDLEPDLFVYNIGGKSGKFIYGLTNGFQTIPFEPIKVTKTDVGSFNVSFQIIDDNGTIYKFEDYANVISDYSAQKNTRNTWYLTSMISNNFADTIRFTYDRFYYEDEVKQQSYPIGKAEICNPTNYTMTPQIVTGNSYGLPIESVVPTHYNELLVNKIYFKEGAVEFKRNTVRIDDQPNNNKMLDQIVVTNTINQVIKRIDFNHDYYVATIYNSESTRRRLKLTGFSECGTDTVFKKQYNFDYNSTLLPGFGKFSMDYWGYYNGMDSNSGLIPATTVYASELNGVSFANGENFGDGFADPNMSWSVGNANRNPDATAIKAGVLTKITYPTGGYTLMEYEPQQYLSDVYAGQTKIGGGLRIKRIKNFSSSNNLLKQETYKYGTAENGLGVKIFDEQNFYRNYEDVVMAYYRNAPGGSCILEAALVQRNFLGISKYNTFNYQGSPILYPLVTKYEGDETNNTGKTVYQYNILPEQVTMPNEFINSGNYGAINTNWHQGELTNITTYSYTGGQYVPVTKITNEYSSYNLTTSYGIQVRQFKQFINACPGCLTDASGPEPSSIKPGQGFFSIYQYPIPSGASRKTKETTIMYSQSNQTDYTTTITNYQYANQANRYLTETSTTLSEPNSLSLKRFKYPQDLTGAVYVAMVAKNILTPVVEEKTLKSVNSIESQLSTVATNFKQVGNLFVPDNITASTLSLPLETRIQYNQYDTFGNILEQQKPSGVKEVYLWSYKSHYPVAKIVGSDYSTVMANITQSQIDAAVSNDATMRSVLNVLRTNLSGAYVTTYTYSPLVGMTSQTDPNGLTTYYDYDTFSRVKNVRDKDQYILGRNYYHYYSDTSSDVPILTLGTTSISLARTASFSSFAITSNCTWTVTSSQPWLTVSPSSGSLSSSVTVTATANSSYSRTATVTVTYGNGLTKTVNITQLAGNNTLSTNITTLNFGNAPGSSPVTVTSNTSWIVTTSQTWITTSPTSGTGNGTVTITVSNMPNGNRSGYVFLKTADGSNSVTISIFQGVL